MPRRPLSSSGISPSSLSLSHWASAHLGWGSTWDPGPLTLWGWPHTVSRQTAAGSPRGVHQPACAELAARASAGPQLRARRAAGRCRGSAPGPRHRTPADTGRQRRGGGGGDSATSGIPGTKTTNGIVKTLVKDVLPAMQPLDSLVAHAGAVPRSWRPDRPQGAATHGVAATSQGGSPAAAGRSAPITAPGRLGSRVAPGPQAARGCGPRVQTLGSAHPEGANLAARPGTAAGVREEVSARLKDCLVPRRQRQGGPGSRFLACQLQAPLGGKEAGGGREACSLFEVRVGS